ncbi:hypothetical protein EV127DRAFT_443472 [Xylaria flabelliformis]|nr:hypothetical protein EV127DRAFT_443472 [Xylaria flabelliformis]
MPSRCISSCMCVAGIVHQGRLYVVTVPHVITSTTPRVPLGTGSSGLADPAALLLRMHLQTYAWDERQLDSQVEHRWAVILGCFSVPIFNFPLGFCFRFTGWGSGARMASKPYGGLLKALLGMFCPYPLFFWWLQYVRDL